MKKPFGASNEDEIVSRREAALKRMLSTPPKRHKPLGKKTKAASAKRASSKPKSA
jgi:hypothetical protein